MRPRPLQLAALVLLCSAARPVLAAAPNYDRRAQVTAAAAELAAARTRINAPALRAVATVAEMDDRLGVPTFLWAKPAPQAAAGAANARAGTRPSVEQAAQGHLARLAPFYGLDRVDVSTAVLRRVHDTGRGGIIASYGQSIGGVEVFGEEVRLLMDRNLDLLAASGNLASRNTGPIAPFTLDAARAVARALEDFTGTTAAAARPLGAVPGGFEAFEATQGVTLSDPIRTKRVLFHLPGRLEPAYSVEVMGQDEAHLYVFSAVDGSLLLRHDLIDFDSFGYRVWSDPGSPHMPLDGPQGSDPSPLPSGSPAPYSPALIAPILVTLQNGPIPTNDPWLAPGATVTNGNNVDAYVDLASPDGFSGSDFRASTTGPNAFDRVYDTSQAPNVSSAQRMASIAQLFYTTNFLHDWYYAAGFDEVSGNAQVNNYGRGGVQGDGLRAEAQDFSGTNNANMSTPQDGGRPRMQMYVFNPTPVVTLTVNSPASIAGSKAAGRASFGPQNFSVTAQAILVVDGVAPTGDGCSAITNSLTGKIAIMDRNLCTFTTQVQNAQNAGAVGAIIVNSAPGTPPALGGSSGTITIPAVSVSQSDGAAIKAELANNVNITITGATQLARDGSIDNQIVAHEYAHYVSNRLIGNAGGLGNLQGGGMGEGWGDFESLLLTVRPEDALLAPGDFSGVYGMGAYAISPSTAGSSAYYFGVRRYPYTTDMTKNPLTFQHIQDGTPLPAGPPINPNAGTNSEVHNTGSVWCTMLWECYAALLRDTGRLTFDQAQTRMRDYLIAAYKMTPLNPTFTEARDAVLAVALANDPFDHEAFCDAFAKRGCGSGAISPPRFSNDNVGVTESYACGGALEFASASLSDDLHSCDNDGVVDNGESGTLAISLRNTGGTSLSSTTVTVTSSNPAITFPSGNVATMSNSQPFTTSTGSLPIGVSGASGVTTLDFSLAISDPGLVAAAAPGTLVVPGNADPVPSTIEDVEFANSGWTISGNPLVPANAWQRTLYGSDYRFHAPDVGGISDQYLVTPPLDVAATGNFSFTFQEAHEFETSGGVFYDGGVIEISTNGGASWSDIGSAASPGYGGVIFTGANNPISGRSAYVATNAAWPGLNTVTVGLGTAYAGQTVKIRFRLATDEAAGGDGWQIDDLAFTNLTNQPFMALDPETTACSAVAVGDEVPAEFGLSVAGANPSRGLPSLRFSLPQPSRVTIALYDVAGRRVALLANGEFPAGYHATPVRGAVLPGGVYFAKMDVAGTGKSFVRRLVILQ